MRYLTASGKYYAIDAARYQGDDGELLDLEPASPEFPWEAIARRPASLWRYREALPVADWARDRVSLGEGCTPLAPFGEEHPALWCKLDYLTPTLSFKDRGAAVLIAKALELGARRCIADSSGNAGTAVAAYCARAGLPCEVFVPASASPKKLVQMRAHGAEVRAIDGSREEVAAAALRAVEASGAFYASHVFNPFFYEGVKTYAFEVVEQLGRPPEIAVVPAGNGTLVLGCWIGFQQLLAAGEIPFAPRLVAVQADRCAPLAEAFDAGRTDADPVCADPQPTAAEGIAIAAPRRGRQILAAIQASRGRLLTVSEAQILAAQQALAARGLFVEITSAVNYAGYLRLLEQEPGAAEQDAVLPLCGAGLKSA